MKNQKALLFWGGALLLTLVLIYYLSAILLPFVAGMAIAYFLDPFCDRLEERGCSRTLATTIVAICFSLVVLLLLGLIVPTAVIQLSDFIAQVPKYLSSLQEMVKVLSERLDDSFWEDMIQRARESSGQLTDMLWTTLSGIWSGGMALINLLSLLFLTPIVSFFLLRDWDKLVQRIDSWLPRRQAPTIRQLAGEADDILAAWVRGVLMVCVILATFYSIALTLIGLQSGLVVGIISGFLSFIPFVGALTGFVLSVGVALLQFDSLLPVLMVAAVYGIGQVAEGNFLTPMLVGDRVGLHPVLAIFAFLAGGALFGFTGVMLALPVAAVLGVLIRYGLKRYLDSSLYRKLPQESDPESIEDRS
ncbi:AI-2E family transporter [Fodinicurvata fenggangensis]|uniref:AI-2E family transporter n=1 Tax=Fodinicurvata fenggangensis TaxID=1121830 RepID=UPI0006921E6D|nr:AI-2E family transporter [Fodinicurvata fenggangensis]